MGNVGFDGYDATSIRGGMVLPGIVLSHIITSGDQIEAVFTMFTGTDVGTDDGALT